MEAQMSMSMLCENYEQGEFDSDEFKSRLEVALFESAIKNDYSTLDEVDTVMQKFLSRRGNGSGNVKEILDEIISVIKSLQSSSFPEIRAFFSARYKKLLILCRRFQNSEFDVLEFRDRLETVCLPDNRENEAAEKAYEKAIQELDSVEYLYDNKDTNEIGKVLADELISAIKKQ